MFKNQESNNVTNPWLSSMLLWVLESHWLDSVKTQDAGTILRYPGAQHRAYIYSLNHVLNCQNHYDRNINVTFPWILLL